MDQDSILDSASNEDSKSDSFLIESEWSECDLIFNVEEGDLREEL